MAHLRCFDLLQEISNDAREIRFSSDNDARLEELFEMTVAGDTNRLQNAEAKYRDALLKHDKLQLEAEEQRHVLKQEKEELNQIEKKIELLKNEKNLPSCKMTEDTLKKLRMEIKAMLNVLKMYKDFTGVRFEFKNFPEAVVGCVVVKGAIPSKSVFRPFCIKKPYKNVVDDIWCEIHAASEF